VATSCAGTCLRIKEVLDQLSMCRCVQQPFNAFKTRTGTIATLPKVLREGAGELGWAGGGKEEEVEIGRGRGRGLRVMHKGGQSRTVGNVESCEPTSGCCEMQNKVQAMVLPVVSNPAQKSTLI
jgi:hypothetical protein